MLISILDLLFPKQSLTGKEGQWMTDDERKQLRLVPVRFHQQLLRKEGMRYLDNLVAAGTYRASPLLKKAILTFKYSRIPDLHYDLADAMNKAIDGLLLPPAGAEILLVPVPLHWTRRFQRGFNQSELLATVIAEKRGWKTAHLLRRIRPTGHQARRTRAKRLTALTNAFRFSSSAVHPAYIVLVDDLATTCATLDECAKTLKQAGIQRVDALVIARG